MIAGCVSFAETALTVLVNFAPSAVTTDVLTIGATFWNPVTCFGSASTVYFERLAERRVGREHVGREHLAGVERRVRRDAGERQERRLREPVLLRVADEARVARLALREAAELEAADLLQVADRLQAVLLRRRVRDGDHVGVVERRRLEDGVALRRLELLRELRTSRRPSSATSLVEDVLHDHARVLGVEVDLAARERRLDQLGRADVLLVGDVEALRLERLLVELAEDELLGEVLRADDDRRARRRFRVGRPREDGRH